jgi:hypothetical protein
VGVIVVARVGDSARDSPTRGNPVREHPFIEKRI